MLCIFDGIVYDISQRFCCPFHIKGSRNICIMQSQRQPFFSSFGGILFYYAFKQRLQCSLLGGE